MPYVGRFAPSPTGPLHFGSLIAALASYLDAKKNNGTWLVRIEDLDPPREMPGASDSILMALESHQLISDDEIVFQSQRHDLYQQALDTLTKSQHVFPCDCSRKQLAPYHGLHITQCECSLTQPHAWRFSSHEDRERSFEDGLQQRFSQNERSDIGDFVVKRKDGLWAYQLAMVVDDEQQGITHVVRGIDLIDSTLRQNLLQQALNFPQPQYAHLPVACADNGQKLSKQNHAPELDISKPENNIWRALSWLRQNPPQNLSNSSVKELLQWGIEHWDQQPLVGLTSQPANLAGS